MKYIKKFYTKSEKAKYITEDAVYTNIYSKNHKDSKFFKSEKEAKITLKV